MAVGVIFFVLLFFGIAYLGITLVDWFLGFLEFVPRIYQEEILPLLNYLYMEITERLTFADTDMTAKMENIIN